MIAETFGIPAIAIPGQQRLGAAASRTLDFTVTSRIVVLRVPVTPLGPQSELVAEWVMNIVIDVAGGSNLILETRWNETVISTLTVVYSLNTTDRAWCQQRIKNLKNQGAQVSWIDYFGQSAGSADQRVISRTTAAANTANGGYVTLSVGYANPLATNAFTLDSVTLDREL